RFGAAHPLLGAPGAGVRSPSQRSRRNRKLLLLAQLTVLSGSIASCGAPEEAAPLEGIAGQEGPVAQVQQELGALQTVESVLGDQLNEPYAFVAKNNSDSTWTTITPSNGSTALTYGCTRNGYGSWTSQILNNDSEWGGDPSGF